MSPRRHFSERFRRDAAARVLDGNHTQAQVARDLGLHPTTLGRWVAKERRIRNLGPRQLSRGQQAPSRSLDVAIQLDRYASEIEQLSRENEFLSSIVEQLLDDARAMRRYQLIAAAVDNGDTTPVAAMCDALGVSRTGYIRWRGRKPDSREAKREKLDELVLKIYKESGEIYGAPRIVRALKQMGMSVGHQTVYRSMYRQGLAGENRSVPHHPRPSASYSNPPSSFM